MVSYMRAMKSTHRHFYFKYFSFRAEPAPLKSSTSGSAAPKVVKRKAPAPVDDIAISRPVAPKPQTGQGLIPPPPPPTSTSTPAASDEMRTTSFTTEVEQERKKSVDVEVQKENKTCDQPGVEISKPKKADELEDLMKLDEIKPVEKKEMVKTTAPVMTKALTIDGGTCGGLGNIAGSDNSSSEKLIQMDPMGRSRTPSPAPSPKCLRPYRKIDDVTTVKRQPKTGWL